MEERVTFCRICEALCGLVATVDDGRLVRLRPDRHHPLSRGYACPKGIAMADVQNHPQRVLRPLRRRTDGGGLEEVDWDLALEEIGARLRATVEDHGPGSVAWYMGNPGAFSYSHALWVKGFLDALGTPHHYTAGSQDSNSRLAASALLYGSPLTVPIPDLPRTRLLLIIGANPLVSHGSLLSAPRIREHLDRIPRVVVVDPRRSETARAYEHLPIRPDADAHLLLSLLHTLFDEGLEAPVRQARGVKRLHRWTGDFPPEATERRTGIPARTVRRLARDLADAESAAVYGRTGSCLGRSGTLVAFLIDALNAVTGNLDRPGGAVFGSSPIPLDRVGERFGLATYGNRRSRVGGFPDVIGTLPASLMAEEMETPGPGQIKALFTSAGNPVLSVPDGPRLERAMRRLELHVSLDLFVNETNRHADFVLPATTFLERDDVAVASLGFYVEPFVQHADPVLAPYGEARQEWEVVEALGDALGVTPSSVRPVRWLGRAGIRITPQRTLDALLRVGPGRLSVAELRRRPHGLRLADRQPTGVWDRPVRLAPPEIGAEIERLARLGDDGGLRLIGLRELRAHNSWMQGVPRLTARRAHALRVHPVDAERHGLGDGDLAELSSDTGRVTVPVKVTQEMVPGTVALPHGWASANSNLLASSRAEDLEPLAGMAHLNGIAVRLAPARARVASLGAARRSSRLPTAR